MNNYFKHKMRGKSPVMIAGMIVLGIIGITGLAILFGFVIMWLWNWLMPELFGLPLISYWQAVGLFILLKILIGGCGGKGHHSKHHNSEHKCGDGKKYRKDFNKWSQYDKFWEQEGEKAYQKFIDDSNDKSNETTDENQ
jgi:hypothetical protein